VISNSPCGKAYSTTKASKAELVDLPIENPLEELLRDFAGGYGNNKTAGAKQNQIPRQTSLKAMVGQV
jgi:hypothetical protein